MTQLSNRTIATVSMTGVLLVAGCSIDFGRKPVVLADGAGIVQLAHNPPPEDCAELGLIVGLTDRVDRIRFTRLEIVEQDQDNALRNAAHALGGDYVYLDPDDPKANSGTAFQCDSHRQAPPLTPPPRPVERTPSRTEAVPSSPAAPAPQSPGPTTPAELPDSIKDRLRLLQSLYQDGLITAEEYAAKKKDILDEL